MGRATAKDLWVRRASAWLLQQEAARFGEATSSEQHPWKEPSRDTERACTDAFSHSHPYEAHLESRTFL